MRAFHVHWVEAQSIAMNQTHLDRFSSSAISKRNRKVRKEGIYRYTSVTAIVVDRREKPQNVKFCRYRALLDTWVR